VIPLLNDILPIAQNIVDHEEEVFVARPGASMEEILGLPKDWVPVD
jgi:hypothetical protein